MDALPLVRAVVERDEVASTSDLARELLNDEGTALPLPLLVVTDRQTAGRGRGSRDWWSDAGSLTFTVGLDPADWSLPLGIYPRLALMAAVGVVEAIAPWLAPGAAGIRWPNDVEIDGRKVAGILPEWIDTANGPRLLLGIGLNLTTDLDAAPAVVRRMATSIDRERRPGAVSPGKEDVLRALLAWLETGLDDLAREEPGLASRWADLDTLRHRRVRIHQGGSIVSGVALGIDDEGALIVVPEGGTAPLRVLGGSILRD